MRLIGLDFLRGIAAFGIFGCHLSLSPRTAGGGWATCLCDFNVGVFAVIAGLLKGRPAQIASALGVTSMGAYLTHPLLTRGLSVIWARVFPSPLVSCPLSVNGFLPGLEHC